MSISDIFSVIQWWFILFIVGLVFIPFTQHFFSSFFDKGYLFSKMLGLSVTSYTIFLLGIVHILPFSSLDSWFILVVWFLILQLRWIPTEGKLFMRRNIFSFLSTTWKIAFWEEVMFFICLLVWSYVRATNPDIHGLEKYMDFGFVNSILRSTYFPPRDIWFTPLPINYYYFGHLMTAVLIKLSNIPSNIAFNLMIATIFGLSFSAAFSIGSNLVYFFRKQIFNRATIVCGLLSAFLVTLGGNLHIIYAFFAAYPNDTPVPPWQLKFQPFAFPNGYWYPNATRFIYHTIHEFPIYSWVVSDLHGHVLDIPFVLTTIALLLAIMFKIQPAMSLQINDKNAKNRKTLQSHIPASLNDYWSSIVNWKLEIGDLQKKEALLVAFLLAVMYMTNAWDGAIYFLLTVCVLFGMQWKTRTQNRISIAAIISNTFYTLLFIGATALIFTLPYSFFFKPFASGIGIICAPSFLTKIGKIGPFLFEANHCDHSPWWQLLILYGFFAFFVISFIILLIKNHFIHRSVDAKIVQSQKVSSSKKTAVLLSETNTYTDTFVLCLIILSVVLIILPEFIYLKDIYPTYYRANTMFKLVFQAFMMLSLASAYILFRFATWFKTVLRIKQFVSTIVLGVWLIIALFMCGLISLYPYMAIGSYYANLGVYHGLDGTKYLQGLYPSDYAAIQWLNKNISGQPVILEAQGDSYTDYARVSANTGLPTVLGWTVHEWLWRGSYDIPAPRITDVQTMYESTDLQLTKQLLQKYNVQYVFLGDLERQKYPTLDAAKFAQLGKVVYQNGTTKIYKLIIQ